MKAEHNCADSRSSGRASTRNRSDPETLALWAARCGELCFREEAILVTADTEFPAHIKRYQKEHNDCCRGLLLLPSEELKQTDVLKRLKNKKIILKHPVDDEFSFETARWDNLLINLKANPPQVSEFCNCRWPED